jgi:plasmid stability protein
MGQILIRNLDDAVIERLKRKAALNGHSLQQELRNILTAAAPLTAEEKVILFKSIRAQCPPMPNFDVSAAIRYGRDDGLDT